MGLESGHVATTWVANGVKNGFITDHRIFAKKRFLVRILSAAEGMRYRVARSPQLGMLVVRMGRILIADTVTDRMIVEISGRR